jgi:serine/threonine-protein kinase
VSPDGRYVALSRDGQRERNDILIADRQTGRTEPLLATDFDEDHPAFSPDGRFLAYAANDSGRSEVYVRPFPGPGAKYLISTEGGTGPIWSRDGHALFYAEGTKLMRVEISATPRFAAGEPRLVVQSSEIVWERARNYDVLPDGSFIVVRRGNVTLGARTLRAVFNWFAELDRLAPAGR